MSYREVHIGDTSGLAPDRYPNGRLSFGHDVEITFLIRKRGSVEIEECLRCCLGGDEGAADLDAREEEPHRVAAIPIVDVNESQSVLVDGNLVHTPLRDLVCF